jgi:acetyl-CoA carboxylase biotin carboxyl carrier protein
MLGSRSAPRAGIVEKDSDEFNIARWQNFKESGVGKEILTYGDLMQIVDLIKSSEGFSEFHMKVGEIELHLRRAGGEGPHAGTVPAVAPTAAPAAATQAAPTAAVQQATPSTKLAAAAKAAPAAAANFPPGSVIIKSPMVGTFYRRPEPGAKPFVEVGQKIAADTTVCIIEVMKLFNSIPAGKAGTVTHILVDDGAPVESGQLLIVIDPK